MLWLPEKRYKTLLKTFEAFLSITYI
jgi:hypothetical protein